MKPYFQSRDGKYVIWHGDCREILPTLPKCDLVLTDPPYGIDLQDNSAGGRHGRKRHAWEYGIQGDKDQTLGLFVSDYCIAENIPTIFFASPKLPWPGEWSSWLVWDKGPAVGGGGDVQRCWKQTWELIQVARTGILNGSRDASVLRFWATPALSATHPAAKPLDLIAYLLRKTTQENATVIDPFVGSGTTLRACKDLGIACTGIELEEKYCEIAARRLDQEVFDFNTRKEGA